MKVTYVKFLTDEDRSRAFAELSSSSEEISFEDDVFCLTLGGLKLLDDKSICYTIASDEDVRRATGRRWRYAFGNV